MIFKISIIIQVLGLLTNIVKCQDEDANSELSNRISDVEKKMSIALAGVSQIDDKYNSIFTDLDLRLDKTIKKLTDVDSNSKIINTKYPEIETKYNSINNKYAEIVSHMNSLKSEIEESNSKLKDDSTSKLDQNNVKISRLEALVDETSNKFEQVNNKLSELQKTMALILSRVPKIEDNMSSKLISIQSKINENEQSFNALESKISDYSKKYDEITQSFDQIKMQKNDLNENLDKKFEILNKIISRQPYKYAKIRLYGHYLKTTKENLDECWRICQEDSRCIAITFAQSVKICYKFDYDFDWSTDTLESENWTSYSLKKLDGLKEYAPNFNYSCDPERKKCWTHCNKGYGSCFTSKTCRNKSDCSINDPCTERCIPY